MHSLQLAVLFALRNGSKGRRVAADHYPHSEHPNWGLL